MFPSRSTRWIADTRCQRQTQINCCRSSDACVFPTPLYDGMSDTHAFFSCSSSLLRVSERPRSPAPSRSSCGRFSLSGTHFSPDVDYPPLASDLSRAILRSIQLYVRSMPLLRKYLSNLSKQITLIFSQTRLAIFRTLSPRWLNRNRTYVALHSSNRKIRVMYPGNPSALQGPSY